ncbi:MAG: 5'-methylthioadenosine/S-adenosylhomocysteine nucleosidase, partial [Clostridia bacterium]|nr:5'-methylthioadenosine/S-adenosylhomocysteine nucleosidase [Clostridia bacterium]
MKCFVIAMDKEAEPLINAMTAVRQKSVCGKRVISGKLFGKKICVVICGVGKVNAACGTQYAIDKSGADEIINIGVAGGLNNSLKIGGIYCISEAVQYDFDLTQLNGTEIGTLDECKTNYLPLKSNGYPEKRLATGDRFNDSKDDFKLLTKTLKADIRDMEGAAIAQVCMHAKVPCRSFKIISDLAGSGSTTEQYLNNLTVCFATFARELKKITELI